eukprot:g6144.t1
MDLNFSGSGDPQFYSTAQYRKAVYETHYTFKNCRNETLVKAPGEIDAQTFDIADLDSCEVLLLDHSSQIQATSLQSSHVFVGPCSGTVYIDSCNDCVFTVACKNLQLRNCKRCVVYVYAENMVVDNSSNLKIAPFNGVYSLLQEHCIAAGIGIITYALPKITDGNGGDAVGWVEHAPSSLVTPDTYELSSFANEKMRELFRMFDRELAGSWGIDDVNRNQLAIGVNEKEQLSSEAEMKRMFESVGIEITDDYRLTFGGFADLHRANGVDELLKDLEAVGIDVNVLPVWCIKTEFLDAYVAKRTGTNTDTDRTFGLDTSFESDLAVDSPALSSARRDEAVDGRDSGVKKQGRRKAKGRGISSSRKSRAQTSGRRLNEQSDSSMSEKRKTIADFNGNRELYRRYLHKNFYNFSKQDNQYLRKESGEIDGEAFTLSDLKSCEVILADVCAQVTCDRLTHSQVFIGPTKQTVFLRDCNDCEFTVACNQFRIRDCHRCTVYLFSQTDPVIESSDELQFANFNGAYPELAKHFRQARLDPTDNHWKNVFDFNADDSSVLQSGNSLTGSNHWCLHAPGPLFTPNGKMLTKFALEKLRELFRRFDSKGIGSWGLEDVNAYQLGTGATDQLHSVDEMRAMFGACNVPLTPEGRLSFEGFGELYRLNGEAELRKDFGCVEGADLSVLPVWVHEGSRSTYLPPVNPVSRNASAKSVSDRGHKHTSASRRTYSNATRRPVSRNNRDEKRMKNQKKKTKRRSQKRTVSSSMASTRISAAARKRREDKERRQIELLREKEMDRSTRIMQRTFNGEESRVKPLVNRHTDRKPKSDSELEAELKKAIKHADKYQRLRKELCLDRPGRYRAGTVVTGAELRAALRTALGIRWFLSETNAIVRMAGGTENLDETDGIVKLQSLKKFLLNLRLRGGQKNASFDVWAAKKAEEEAAEADLLYEMLQKVLAGEKVDGASSLPISKLLKKYDIIPEWAANQEASSLTNTYMDSLPARSAIRKRAARLKSEDNLPEDEAMKKATDEIRSEKLHAELSSLKTSPERAIELFKEFRKASFAPGGSGQSFEDWLKTRHEHQLRNRAALEQWQAQKAADARRLALEEGRCAPVEKVKEKLAEFMSGTMSEHELPKSGIRVAHPSREGLCLERLRQSLRADHVVSLRELREKMECQLFSLLADGRVADTVRPLFSGRYAAERKLRELLKEEKWKLRLERAAEKARQQSDGKISESESMKIARETIISLLEKDVFTSLFTLGKKEAEEERKKLETEHKQNNEKAFKNWFSKKEAARRAAKRMEMEEKKKKKAAEALQKKKASEMYEKWKESESRGHFFSRKHGRLMRRLPMRPLNARVDRPPWEDVCPPPMSKKEREEAEAAAKELERAQNDIENPSEVEKSRRRRKNFRKRENSRGNEQNERRKQNGAGRIKGGTGSRRSRFSAKVAKRVEPRPGSLETVARAKRVRATRKKAPKRVMPRPVPVPQFLPRKVEIVGGDTGLGNTNMVKKMNNDG